MAKKAVAKKVKATKAKRDWQVAALIVLLLGLLSISVFATLMAMGVVKYDQPRVSLGSMLDAENMCNGLIKEDHQENLSSFVVDDFSSRYNEQTGEYMMFYEVELKRDVNNPSGVDTYFLNCFVSKKGRLSVFNLVEDKTFVPKAIKRTTGNAFGM